MLVLFGLLAILFVMIMVYVWDYSPFLGGSIIAGLVFGLVGLVTLVRANGKREAERKAREEAAEAAKSPKGRTQVALASTQKKVTPRPPQEPWPVVIGSAGCLTVIVAVVAVIISWVLNLKYRDPLPGGGDPPYPSYIPFLCAVLGLIVGFLVLLVRAFEDPPTSEEKAAWYREQAETERRQEERRARAEQLAWSYNCPECKMQIHRDASICPYCRTRFG